MIDSEPKVTYFKPRAVPISEIQEVELQADELESLRLCDAMKINQTESAERMGVSQSTLQRILTSARRKTAEAIVEGKAIKIHKPQPTPQHNNDL